MKSAFVSAGLSPTVGTLLTKIAGPILKSGQPYRANLADTRSSLGKNADAKIAAAKSVVADAAKSWPGIKDWLNKTGMGNHPGVIDALARRHKHRPAGGR
jgi:hypothetical protein